MAHAVDYTTLRLPTGVRARKAAHAIVDYATGDLGGDLRQKRRMRCEGNLTFPPSPNRLPSLHRAGGGPAQLRRADTVAQVGDVLANRAIPSSESMPGR